MRESAFGPVAYMSDRDRPRPKAFDLLTALAAFAREHNVPLSDPEIIERFMADAKPKLEEALSDPTLLHGSRVERLFEATVLSLGQFRLLKVEDVGRVHAEIPLRAPDFRVVLNDGEQWLVEVKNVRGRKPSVQKLQMSANYLSSLLAYADSVGVPLKIATYWSLWNIWTVVSPERFRKNGNGLRLTMEEALMANEFGRLGEVSIMTTPPLRVVLDARKDMPRSLDEKGLARFIIEAARLFSGKIELTGPRDRKLAEILLFYGDWPAEGPFAIMDGDEIVGAEFVAQPIEPSDQGFDGIGWASRIFSRFYAAQTIDKDNVIQLHGDPAPDWFAPLATWDFKGSKLPLWLMRMKGPEKVGSDTQSSSDTNHVR